jgi:NAD(P)-dependent dehydrogenase (short-subunit alcohol dehydrogenase family)
MTQLGGKVVLVTGASRGIGRATARAFAERGATVVACARSRLLLDELVQELTTAGSRSEAVVLDVTDEAEVDGVLRDLHERLGGLDVLVNNAGATPYTGSATAMTGVDWDATLDVNLRSVFLMCRAAAPLLAGRDGAAIVNVASIDALVGVRGMAAYCAAKAGVVGLTKALAVEWSRDGIRVNCVCPGAVATEMTAEVRSAAESGFHRYLMGHTPQGRFASPDEVAAAIVYLASSAASFVTGAVLPVDGGFSAA